MDSTSFMKLDSCVKKEKKHWDILNAVFQKPGIPRSELTARLGISKNSITSMVNFLIAEGILCESENTAPSKKGAGRRFIGLTFRKDLFYVLGTAFTLADPAILLLDANRNIVEKVPLRHEGSKFHFRFLEEIRQKTASLLNKAGGVPVLGIGVTLSGILDHETGRVISSQAFTLNKEFDLRGFFMENFGLPSLFINTSHIFPVMERLFGAAGEMENFITIDEGLGAGMFLNGKLYRGWQSYAGEFGFMKISDAPPPGLDGRSGILNDLALFKLIGEKIITVMKNGGQVQIERSWSEDEYIQPLQVVKAVEEGNLFVAQLLAEIFGSIGEAVVNVAYLLNPQVIFLPWWTARVPQFTLDVVRMKMGSYGLSNWQMKTEILPSQCRGERYAETAGYCFLEEYFQGKLK